MRNRAALGTGILGLALTLSAAAVLGADHEPPRHPGPLDLSPPPLNHVLSARELQALEAEPDVPADNDVEVAAGRYRPPVPNGFLFALPWAVMHPLQAWRVFTPVTEE